MEKTLNREQRRQQIKSQLNKLYGKPNIKKNTNDIFNQAVKRFMDKGYSRELSETKALFVMGTMIPEGYAIGKNPTTNKVEIYKIDIDEDKENG